jgi:hypothetical protein
MKKSFFLMFSFFFILFSCKKEIETSTSPIIEVSATDKVLLSGNFMNASHPTSGSVKLIEGADKKKYLVFDNLKSDAGPDLRIYLSEDNTAKNFTEVSNKVVNGNTKIEVPAAANTDKQKTVLIWCKQFSVLFGSAALK